MIRINLLESSKGKNKRGGSCGPTMPTMEMGDMGSPKLKVLVVLLLAGAEFWLLVPAGPQGKRLRRRCSQPSRKSRTQRCESASTWSGRPRPTTTSGGSM
jgi:hypothetical protein